ncbi:MAG: chemotaxis response regulator protein-glutamate methylesterase [Firmicutes bacterium]|nr:chemotaxis response regulator protein-glutamate methylesterase [Dethiobacter sp.]MBS3897317.1 chemotaxis response regulator protein-glutamate methylesterase [Dethiobacter sp.]MCL4462948.1 chemotaxis response regulator protein-glutamate methylesterase [Bacillota bacterium]MCL5992709.1 chemotaxis response regulator protein-glutamate methylesterase [Bacillota bacterium]
MEQIKVLVVDDSALMRKIVSDIFSADARFAVVDTARDGIDALEKMVKLNPDLITLDVEMPRLDGLQTLKEIVRRHKAPVIMLSSLTKRGSHVTMEALSIGAVDFIAKPDKLSTEGKAELQRELLLKAAVATSLRVQVAPLPAERPAMAVKPALSRQPGTKAVAIGASTGGPRALEAILLSLPGNLPATVFVTQHMPPKFTQALAERLNKSSAIRIKEAEDGEPVLTGVVYLAPGNFHMEITADKKIRLTQDPPVEHVRPSVTVMMLSVALVYGKESVGVILTGMGKDGAAGMAEIKKRGGHTLAQDEASAVIFSMPKAAIQAGTVERVLSLEEIAGAITALCGGNADGQGHGL